MNVKLNKKYAIFFNKKYFDCSKFATILSHFDTFKINDISSVLLCNNW